MDDKQLLALIGRVDVETPGVPMAGLLRDEVKVSDYQARLLAIARAVQDAERERLKADAENWGNALNEAAWAATEAYRRHTGQVEPAIFFNHAKGILRDALAVYFKALSA